MDRVGYSAIGKKEILLSAVWVRSQYREERLLASQCLSVCLSVCLCIHIGHLGIFMKFDPRVFFEKSVEKI